MDKEKLAEFEIGITTKIDVDRNTAELCLRLVEMYVNSNPVCVVCDRKLNGEQEFRYEPIR